MINREDSVKDQLGFYSEVAEIFSALTIVIGAVFAGLLLMMWRKLETWITTTRVEQGNPRFGEWVQWLAERIAEEEAGMVPAYAAYSHVKKLH